jgi:hypothetical protein
MQLAILIIVSLILATMVASGVFTAMKVSWSRVGDENRQEHHELALAETAILIRALGVRVERRGTSWRTTLPDEEEDIELADCLFEIVDHMMHLDTTAADTTYFDLLAGRQPGEVLQLIKPDKEEETDG